MTRWLLTVLVVAAVGIWLSRVSIPFRYIVTGFYWDNWERDARVEFLGGMDRVIALDAANRAARTPADTIRRVS